MISTTKNSVKGEGVQNPENSADVICECPQSSFMAAEITNSIMLDYHLSDHVLWSLQTAIRRQEDEDSFYSIKYESEPELEYKFTLLTYFSPLKKIVC